MIAIQLWSLDKKWQRLRINHCDNTSNELMMGHICCQFAVGVFCGRGVCGAGGHRS